MERHRGTHRACAYRDSRGNFQSVVLVDTCLFAEAKGISFVGVFTLISCPQLGLFLLGYFQSCGVRCQVLIGIVFDFMIDDFTLSGRGGKKPSFEEKTRFQPEKENR